MIRKKDNGIFYLFILLITIVIAYGCKQVEYVYVPRTQVRDSLITKVLHDSIFIKVKEYERNDTIYHDSLVYKYVFRNDTIRVSHIDSIPYPIEVPKYIERDLNTYQKTFIRLGWAFILALLAFIGWKVIKLYLRK